MCVRTIAKAMSYDDKEDWQIHSSVRMEVLNHIRDTNRDSSIYEEEVDE